MRKYLFLFACFLYAAASGQNVFRYEYDITGSGFDSGEGGVSYRAADKTYYVSGITDKTVTLYDDPLLIKVNSAGALVFVKQYMFTGNLSYEYITCGKITSDDGYLMYGTTDFKSSGDILLIKTTSTGAISWSREIDGGAAVFSTSRFYEKSGGGFLLTGSVSGVGAGSSDAFVISISADGNTINFAKAYGTSRAENSYSIIEHSSGKISFVGSTDVDASVLAQGWWVELNSTGAINWSKSLGGTVAKAETFQDLIETTANNYFVIGNYCSSGVTSCSCFYAEFNTTTGAVSNKYTFQTNPVGTVFKTACVYRTPDNNSYWIGGIISGSGGLNDCLMIKTGSASPSPSTGYAIGDADEQGFTFSVGAVPGNDEFVLGGTEIISGSDWRSSIIKSQSALQCNSTTINFSTTALGTSAADVTTTITDLTGLTLYNLNSNPDVVTVDRTASTTAYQDCFQILPVELLSFSGLFENNYSKLFWSTASEENNNFFTLERSSDGKTFSEIARINGAGTTNAAQHYQFIDSELPPAAATAALYYRLSQTDFNGQHEELGIVSVKLSGSGNSLSMTIQSNPVAADKLNLNLFSPIDDEVSLSVSDLHGKTIRTQKILLQKNETALISFDLAGNSKGVYFISAFGKSSSLKSKFLHIGGE